jgi:hypothetical protein
MPAKTKRHRRSPKKALQVTTYDRLEEYLRAFAAGHFHLLVLVGAGGLAKSRSVRAVLDGQACWIEGNATPFGMYAKPRTLQFSIGRVGGMVITTLDDRFLESGGA